MKLSWTHQAFGDREAILDHIARDNAIAAVETDDLIVAAVENLLVFPMMGRLGRVAQVSGPKNTSAVKRSE